jgi:DNA-directed RNA polymerase specialized sigma24 family protein
MNPADGDGLDSALKGGRFATTQWSVVLAAGNRHTAESAPALAALCQAYWYPLYAYARRRVTDPAEAQDLTQSFFAELLEKNYVAPATPERGRFRAYLLTAFKHFLGHEWEEARALKRGGGRSPISLNFNDGDSRIGFEPKGGLTADELYDREWAMALLERVIELLMAEWAAAGKAEQFEQLKPFLIGESGDRRYDEAASALGTTVGAAKMAASRLRQRYRQILREMIGQTVENPEEVDDEIRGLFKTLGT